MEYVLLNKPLLQYYMSGNVISTEEGKFGSHSTGEELPFKKIHLMPQRIESRVSKRKLHIRVPSSILHNSEEPEATQVSTNG